MSKHNTHTKQPSSHIVKHDDAHVHAHIPTYKDYTYVVMYILCNNQYSADYLRILCTFCCLSSSFFFSLLFIFASAYGIIC